MAQPNPPGEPGQLGPGPEEHPSITQVAPEYVERPWLAPANGGETIVTRLARVEAAIPRLEEDIRGLVERLERMAAFLGYKA